MSWAVLNRRYAGGENNGIGGPRLADYDSGLLQRASEELTKEDLERYKHQLETLRKEQLARARTVGD